MSSRNRSVWPTNHDPSRLEIVVGIWAIFQSYLFFSATDTPISWVWLAVGVAVAVVAVGPVAASSVGKRIGRWFEEIGTVGRVIALIVAIAVIWAVETTVAIPNTPKMNFTIGGLFAIGVVIVLEAIRTRVIPS